MREPEGVPEFDGEPLDVRDAVARVEGDTLGLDEREGVLEREPHDEGDVLTLMEGDPTIREGVPDVVALLHPVLLTLTLLVAEGHADVLRLMLLHADVEGECEGEALIVLLAEGREEMDEERESEGDGETEGEPLLLVTPVSLTVREDTREREGMDVRDVEAQPLGERLTAGERVAVLLPLIVRLRNSERELTDEAVAHADVEALLDAADERLGEIVHGAETVVEIVAVTEAQEETEEDAVVDAHGDEDDETETEGVCDGAVETADSAQNTRSTRRRSERVRAIKGLRATISEIKGDARSPEKLPEKHRS